MAEHTVKMKIADEVSIGNVDVAFRAEIDGKYLGDVRISQGGIDWHKSGAHTDQAVTWTEFAEWMSPEK